MLEKVGIKCDTELQKKLNKGVQNGERAQFIFVIYCVYLEDAFLFY